MEFLLICIILFLVFGLWKATLKWVFAAFIFIALLKAMGG